MFFCNFAAYFQNTFSSEHIWTAASGQMYLGSSLKMGAGTETSKFCSGHDHKIMMEVEVYCKHKLDLTASEKNGWVYLRY